MKRIIVFLLFFAFLLPSLASAESELVFAFDSFEYDVLVGKTIKLKPVLQGAEIQKGVVFEWESSDTAVASLKSGTVKGISSGTTKITCRVTVNTGDTLTATCLVNVLQPIKKIKIDADDNEINLVIDKPTQFSAIVEPSDASNQVLQWTSSNEKIATVSTNGEVIAKAVGKCKIVATATDGSKKKASVSITVPHICVEAFEYTISTPEKITIPYWMQGTGSLSLKYKDTYFDINENFLPNFLKKGVPKYEKEMSTLDVKPKKAGTGKVSFIYNGTHVGSVKITVEHSAVYDEVSYPPLKREILLSEYEKRMGEKTSVSGTVLQNIDQEYTRILPEKNGGETVLIAYKPKIKEGDSIVVYGTVGKPIEYKTETGLVLLDPYIECEKFEIKR